MPLFLKLKLKVSFVPEFFLQNQPTLCVPENMQSHFMKGSNLTPPNTTPSISFVQMFIMQHSSTEEMLGVCWWYHEENSLACCATGFECGKLLQLQSSVRICNKFNKFCELMGYCHVHLDIITQ